MGCAKGRPPRHGRLETLAARSVDGLLLLLPGVRDPKPSPTTRSTCLIALRLEKRRDEVDQY